MYCIVNYTCTIQLIKELYAEVVDNIMCTYGHSQLLEYLQAVLCCNHKHIQQLLQIDWHC